MPGVKFIGPTAAAMDAMGSKTRARQAMERAGVPFVPGTSRGLESFEQAEEVAARIGYPIMLKAAAGGGGKGMRLVHALEELKSALEGARSEAERSFGDSEVYIEKAILNPRHIEMQVLADEHGNTVYLGERECSLQRRHQKVSKRRHRPSSTLTCGAGWAKSRFAWHRQRDTPMLARLNSWSTSKRISISWK